MKDTWIISSCLVLVFIAAISQAQAEAFGYGPFLDNSGNIHWFKSRAAYSSANDNNTIGLRPARAVKSSRMFSTAQYRGRGHLFGQILPNTQTVRFNRSLLSRNGLRRVWRPRGNSVSGF